ncbi:hypothetical protein PE36_20734 [Moritella sp. PE36]|uniref:DUF2846 domain-containing protein n=1 Tax=Moritella sp. PE36 TaxID=58051 RepID=UPI000156881F|nr:DUF2846 domain-containing protein [Moritella sp. PE36]EDM68146.1 hypothetical protein PE36_20734 [Moritella sp. PE36]
MKKVLLATVVTAMFLSGCASVPMESNENTRAAKSFDAPSLNHSVIYVYRKDAFVGSVLKKDILIDDECVGRTVAGVFFYQEVEGNKAHTISTESEFSNNEVTINAESGELYFLEQYIKMGVFVGGAGLKQVDKTAGKREVLKLHLAKKSSCGS